MFKYFQNKRAQSTLEYAVLIVVIIGALLAIQTYIKRGVQGRLKSASDDIGDQFSPDNTNSIHISTSSVTARQDLFGTAGQGQQSTVMANPEIKGITAQSQVLNVQQEDWGP